MELVENVVMHVNHVARLQIIVTLVTSVEFKEVNQLAHAQMVNTKIALVGAKIAHSDVHYVLVLLIVVMNVQM